MEQLIDTHRKHRYRVTKTHLFYLQLHFSLILYSFADPFTGESRYVPGSGSVPGLPPPSHADPFTGSGAYTTASTTTSREKMLIPHDAYIR